VRDTHLKQGSAATKSRDCLWDRARKRSRNSEKRGGPHEIYSIIALIVTLLSAAHSRKTTQIRNSAFSLPFSLFPSTNSTRLIRQHILKPSSLPPYPSLPETQTHHAYFFPPLRRRLDRNSRCRSILRLRTHPKEPTYRSSTCKLTFGVVVSRSLMKLYLYQSCATACFAIKVQQGDALVGSQTNVADKSPPSLFRTVYGSLTPLFV